VIPIETALTLKPPYPCDFFLSSEIFSQGDRQIRIFENGILKQVILIREKPVLAVVKSAGTVMEPELSVMLKSAARISAAGKEEAGSVLSRILNLDLNLAEFYRDVGGDEVLSGITCRLAWLRPPASSSVFEAIVDTVLEQQISIHVAHRLQERLRKTFGSRLAVGGDTYYGFPAPNDLADAGIDRIRGCGLSAGKARCIFGIATAVRDGVLDLEKFRDYNDTEQIIRELDALPGIGSWSAEFTIIRGLRRFDIIPADDLGIRRDVSRYCCGGRDITAAEVRMMAEPWGKWKGLAAFYFMTAARHGIELKKRRKGIGK
jgi:DNA-3-methyladenine glycosylase II